MHGGVGAKHRTHAMPPVQLTQDAHATFIEGGHIGVHQLFFHGCGGGCDLLRDLTIRVHHSRFRQGMCIQIGEYLRRAFQGDKMIDVEVGRLRLQARTGLDWLGDLGGKVSRADLSTLRTGFDFGAMCGHFHAHGRHIKHLAFFVCTPRNLRQRSVALLASRDGMHAQVVGSLDHFQGTPWMTRLPTAGFATGFAQAARAWLGEAITRGRLAAVAAVLAQLVFELLDPQLQLRDHLNQMSDQVDRRFFDLIVDGANLFRRWQWSCWHRLYYLAPRCALQYKFDSSLVTAE